MKTKITLALILTLSISAFAETPKMAFGSINFGDTEEVTMAKLKTQVAELNRRHISKPTAKDLVPDFVTHGTKYPPKLASSYSKTVASVSYGTSPVSTIEAMSDGNSATDYEGVVKQTWEVFRDIADSKFGMAKQNAPFPTKAELDAVAPKSNEIVTCVWEYSGLQIRLSVKSFGLGHYYARLSATNPTVLGAKVAETK